MSDYWSAQRDMAGSCRVFTAGTGNGSPPIPELERIAFVKEVSRSHAFNRMPLENRVWYAYAGEQTAGSRVGTYRQPIATARVLDEFNRPHGKGAGPPTAVSCGCIGRGSTGQSRNSNRSSAQARRAIT